VGTTGPQRKGPAKEHLEKRARKRNMYNGLQVQLEEMQGGSMRERATLRGVACVN